MVLQGRASVVTGGTGFLGRHLAVEVRRAGAEVFALGRRHFDLRRREAIDAKLADHRPARGRAPRRRCRRDRCQADRQQYGMDVVCLLPVNLYRMALEQYDGPPPVNVGSGGR